MDSQSSSSIRDSPDDDNFLKYSPTQQKKKPARQRLTILDDIDQLHEDINGPGALENQLKTKQIIQQTFDRVKEENTQKKDLQEPCKENVNTLHQSQILVDTAKQAKVHGLIAYTMKIDLSLPPSEQNLFIFKSESNTSMFEAPRNSYRRGEGYDLFGKALETVRNHGKKFNHFRI